MHPLRSVLLLALAGAAAASQAALTVYTDRAQFLAALGATTTETFDTDATFLSGDNLYNGINFRVGSQSFGQEVTDGRFFGGESAPLDDSIDLVFSSAVNGFGADFAGANTSEGIAFTILGQTVRLPDYLSDPGSGFLGIVSSEAFTTVDFTLAAADGGESYLMDNLTYGPAGAAPSVPGPVAGLPFALLALRRRKRA